MRQVQRSRVLPQECGSISASPVSLIADASLSTQDLYNLRVLFFRYTNETILGTTFRYLWRTYNFYFSGSCTPLLRYSALALVVQTRTEYFEYVSRFLEELRTVINRDTVEEAHLFAVFIAIFHCFKPFFFDRKAYHTYIGVFCALLRKLMQQHENGLQIYPGRPLWRQQLLCLRRSYRCYDYTGDDPATQVYSMHVLEINLPDYDSDVHEALFLYEAPTGGIWHDTYHRLHYFHILDLTCCLRSGFRFIYQHQGVAYGKHDNTSALARLIDIIRDRLDGFRKYKYFDGIYRVRVKADDVLTL